MPTFADYYHDLLEWEGFGPQELVSQWPDTLIEVIKADFQTAILASNLKGQECPLTANSTNQSIGNQVEIYTIEFLTSHFQRIQLHPCRGAGYPDRKVVADGIILPCEMKATSDWNPQDSNRRVLTSSAEKLRAQFTPPIYHLLCTVMYSYESSAVRIGCVRLDFLEPDSPVNVRLEASVSHKLLSTGTHASLVI